MLIYQNYKYRQIQQQMAEKDMDGFVKNNKQPIKDMTIEVTVHRESGRGKKI